MTTGKPIDQAAESASDNSELTSTQTSDLTGNVTGVKPATVNTNDVADATINAAHPVPSTKEYGGPKGLEPTRYGDWEKNGRCSDF